MPDFRTLATVRHHAMVLTDHEFDVPLDHAKPSGEALKLFARAVRSVKKSAADLPWLVFLQGGPGFPGPRPLANTGWLKRALDDYRVLLLDSRGNGRSSVVLPQTLARRGDARAQADYLMHFRADSIVDDAEWIRRRLAGENEKWSVLGQSYGGFGAVHYLSAHPEGLREAFVTGGLPPLSASADDYYRQTYPEVERKTRKFFARYPQDAGRCERILERLHRNPVALPAGGTLSVRRFQQVGFLLGFDDGMENLHYLLEDAFCIGSKGEELSYPFLRALENTQSFEAHPIFAVLHEMCYTQRSASRWSAHRVREEFPEANWAPGRKPAFTGEMIYPWMFDDYRELRPLREVAEILANEERWPDLYDEGRLARNDVPCAAVVYAEDMYVPRRYSEDTAARIGGMKTWVTNEFEHSGLRTSDRVFERLLSMLHDE
ncbi:MAG TPA: alpha/beta fold hydrolase [Casimicrobiaceae bacterium]|nr:alpha/beta fold hydrolase [Casimicrobiaceae bacterium]